MSILLCDIAPMDSFFHIFCSEFGYSNICYFFIFFFTEQHMRFRRSPQEKIAQGAPPMYASNPYLLDLAAAPAGSNAYAKGPKGRVGPVYTFVKTDPKANFKWGIRHVAGVQYGK